MVSKTEKEMFYMPAKPIDQEPVDKQALNNVEDFYFDLDDVASMTECTGLIPTPPESEAEAESYTDLYPIPRPQKEAVSKKTKKSK